MHYGGDFRMDASKQDLIGQWGEVSIKFAEPAWMRLLAFHKRLYQLPQRLKEDRDNNRWRGSSTEVRIQGLWHWKPWKIRLQPSESCWLGLDNPDGQDLQHCSATSVDFWYQPCFNRVRDCDCETEKCSMHLCLIYIYTFDHGCTAQCTLINVSHLRSFDLDMLLVLI